MKKALALLALFALSACAFGFIEGKPKGEEFRPEMSQEEVAAQQGYQGTQGTVGEVVVDTEPDFVPEIVSESENQASLDQADRDRQNLEASAARAGKAPEPDRGPWLAFIALAVCVLAVFAVRQYANKVVPEPEPKGRDRRLF